MKRKRLISGTDVTLTGRIFDHKLGSPILKLFLRAEYRLHSAQAGLEITW